MNQYKKFIMLANQDIDDGNDADYPPYLCFQALESDFSVCLGGNWHDHVCQYSFNRKDWVNLPARTYTPSIGILQKVYFRANLTPVLVDAAGSIMSIGQFSTTKKCRLSGNPTSMLHGLNWTVENYNTSVPNYGLSYLFRTAKTVSISKDFLNFTSTVTRACYNMFQGNNYLKGTIYITKAGGASSRNGIFMGCFSGCKLDSIVISTTEYAWETYSAAFEGNNIKNIEFPATYIYPAMYNAVCRGCKSLEEAFINGRSLNINTATTSYVQHLNDAFNGCSKLSKVTYLVTNPFDKKYTNNWLTGVAENGTIILNKNIEWDPEVYRNGNIDNIEGSATLNQTITWGIPGTPETWPIKYCDPDNITDVRDYREKDQAW